MNELEREELREGLRRVGLNSYESSVYLGLVTDQSARVSEISKRTGVPQPKVYQALDSLVEKGFCSLGTDSVNRYRPVPPRVAIDAYLARLKGEAEAARRLADELDGLLAAGRGRELWAPPFEILKGMRQVRPALVERIRSASDEILFFGKGPIVPEIEIPRAVRAASEAGVRVRMVLEPDFFDEVEAREEAEVYRSVEASKRELESVPTKLVVIDHAFAALSITRTPGEGFLLLLVRHRGMVEHYVASFEHHWERARPHAAAAG